MIYCVCLLECTDCIYAGMVDSLVEVCLGDGNEVRVHGSHY